MKYYVLLDDFPCIKCKATTSVCRVVKDKGINVCVGLDLAQRDRYHLTVSQNGGVRVFIHRTLLSSISVAVSILTIMVYIK